jgi:hypothetical protein
MGDRAQVKIGDVYLYTHWGGQELVKDVKAALVRGKDRWDDDEYLARIIFSEMIKKDILGLTNYGIGTQQHDDIWRLIEIDCDNDKILLKDDGKPVKAGTFEEFIKDA